MPRIQPRARGIYGLSLLFSLVTMLLAFMTVSLHTTAQEDYTTGGINSTLDRSSFEVLAVFKCNLHSDAGDMYEFEINSDYADIVGCTEGAEAEVYLRHSGDRIELGFRVTKGVVTINLGGTDYSLGEGDGIFYSTGNIPFFAKLVTAPAPAPPVPETIIAEIHEYSGKYGYAELVAGGNKVKEWNNAYKLYIGLELLKDSITLNKVVFEGEGTRWKTNVFSGSTWSKHFEGRIEASLDWLDAYININSGDDVTIEGGPADWVDNITVAAAAQSMGGVAARLGLSYLWTLPVLACLLIVVFVVKERQEIS